MLVTIVVAMGDNGVIGDGHRLPWRLPSDLKRFRQLTWGHPIIIGRRTFESIGKPLIGRTNIILSRDHQYHPENCHVASSIEEGLKIARECVGGEEIMVVGGGEIYRQSIKYCKRIHLTIVEGKFEGSVYFPTDFAQQNEWRVVEEKIIESDANNHHRLKYIKLENADIATNEARALTPKEWSSGFRATFKSINCQMLATC